MGRTAHFFAPSLPSAETPVPAGAYSAAAMFSAPPPWQTTQHLALHATVHHLTYSPFHTATLHAALNCLHFRHYRAAIVRVHSTRLRSIPGTFLFLYDIAPSITIPIPKTIVVALMPLPYERIAYRWRRSCSCFRRTLVKLGLVCQRQPTYRQRFSALQRTGDVPRPLHIMVGSGPFRGQAQRRRQRSHLAT